MENCSRHKKDVAGISDMKVLAEMIGDLHYKCLFKFLHELAQKINIDAINDCTNGRNELAKKLGEASLHIFDSYVDIQKAWQICKPFMDTTDN